MVNFDVHRVFIGLVFGRIREGDVTNVQCKFGRFFF